MRVEILDKDNIREGVPVEITIKDAEGTPRVFVSDLGAVEARPFQGAFRAQFWAMQEGDYRITVRDQKRTWSEHLRVEKQTYMSFGQEFGLFLALFIFFSLGVVAWMKALNTTKE